MASDDGVIVHQVDFEQKRSERCSGCSSPLDPVEVARNLLLNNPGSRKFTIVSSRGFKPWHDSKQLVSLQFKFQPPKLSLDSVEKSKLSADNNKAQNNLPSESCSLLEFSPVYSEQLSLRTQLEKGSCSNSQELCAEGCGPLRQCSHQPTSVCARDDSSRKSKVSQEVHSPSKQSVWCASPYVSSKSRKEKEVVLEKFKETNLQQVKDMHCLNYHQRGKWIIRRTKGSLKGAKGESFSGKNTTLEQLWKKVRSLIKEGHLPHCNAKLQKIQDEVWVYCDFKHSLKVRNTLEKVLGNVGAFHFCIHPVGVVMEL